ncbi:GNAT family N-acetyltransferase [Litorisediminicola beolgyonensis]|uniref:GNAT family N-acetyltransferase n=1 Tax=Litorisediminicola beolgyonensis TaxID=1173614 RepID=A0ABW3ZDW7_9RHOB
MSPRERPFAPEDLDWLVAEHQVHYARSDGFDDSFGALVREVAQGFLDRGREPRETGIVLEDEGTRLGTIFVAEHASGAAQLRLFYLADAARGRGFGYRLLRQAEAFASRAGYTRMLLWTHESHTAAGRLYQSAGWRLVSSEPVHHFGAGMVVQHWERSL